MSDQPDPYHHGNLREALLAAAQQQLKDVGPEKLSLRALAREVGVSQTAPYRHFPNKNLLLVAIAVDGFRQLEAHIRNKAAETDSADEVLQTCAECYIAFAEQNPALYRMMFGSALGEWRKPEFMCGAPPACFSALVEIIERGISQGTVNGEYPAWFLAKSIWAQIHGFAMMSIDGLLDRGIPEGETFDIKKSLRLCFMGKRP